MASSRQPAGISGFSGSQDDLWRGFRGHGRLLDNARAGPFYLRQPEIAELVVDAIDFGETSLCQYVAHTYVVMPNHVHMLMTPFVAVPKLLMSLKGLTAKRANQILGLTGKAFWQGESYDHWVRDNDEFGRIQAYIEQNPVRAGLAIAAEEFPWSSLAVKKVGRGGDRGAGAPPYL